MEKNPIKLYKPSTGDGRWYYHETTAVNDLAAFNSSAASGNLADVLKNGPVTFPNILAPDSPRHIPLARMEIAEPNKIDRR